MDFLRYKAVASLLVVLFVGCYLYQWGKPLTVEQIAVRGLPSVVRIESFKDKVHYSLMAGFVASKYGHIVTCAHGINSGFADVYLPGRKDLYKAVVVVYCKTLDVAILQAPNLPEQTPWLEIDKSLMYTLGSVAVAIGHPEGLSWSVSSGVVSNELFGKLRSVQITAAINPGNSGGPVINSKGKVIGIADSRLMRAEGIGFIVPGVTLATLLRGVLNEDSM